MKKPRSRRAKPANTNSIVAAATKSGWFEPAHVINSTLVLLTLLAVSAAFIQTWISADTAKKQLRAYVEVTEVSFIRSPNGAEVQVKLKNFGQTPAQRLAVYAESKLGAVSPRLTDRGTKTLAPSAETSVGLIVSEDVDELDRLYTGKTSFKVVGGATYRDIYGKKQDLIFSLHYDWKLRTLVPTLNDNWST